MRRQGAGGSEKWRVLVLTCFSRQQQRQRHGDGVLADRNPAMMQRWPRQPLAVPCHALPAAQMPTASQLPIRRPRS